MNNIIKFPPPGYKPNFLKWHEAFEKQLPNRSTIQIYHGEDYTDLCFATLSIFSQRCQICSNINKCIPFSNRWYEQIYSYKIMVIKYNAIITILLNIITLKVHRNDFVQPFLCHEFFFLLFVCFIVCLFVYLFYCSVYICAYSFKTFHHTFHQKFLSLVYPSISQFLLQSLNWSICLMHRQVNLSNFGF